MLNNKSKSTIKYRHVNTTHHLSHYKNRSYQCSIHCHMWPRAAGFGRSCTGRRWPRPTPQCSRYSDRSQPLGTRSPALQDMVSRHTFSQESGFWHYIWQQLLLLSAFPVANTKTDRQKCFIFFLLFHFRPSKIPQLLIRRWVSR